MKSSSPLVQIQDLGENYTTVNVGTNGCPFMLSKTHEDSYREEARRVLDDLSVDFNPMGIAGVMAALLIENLGGYNGNQNE